MKSIVLQRSSKSRSGMSMVSLLVGVAIMGIAVTMGTKLIVHTHTSEDKLHREAAFLDIGHSLLSAQQKDTSGWLDLMRQKSAYLAGCLPSNNTTAYASGSFNCVSPSGELVSDPAIMSKAAGNAQRVAMLDIYDLSGNKIAGTETAPVYLTRDGSPCDPTKDSCILKSTGYLIRENASGSPGSVEFVVATKRYATGTDLQSNYQSILVPEEVWSQVGLNISINQCQPGQVVVGILPNGGVVCRPPFTGTCNSGCYLYGFSEGKPLCRSSVAPAPLPPLRDVGTMTVAGGRGMSCRSIYNVPNIGNGKVGKMAVLKTMSGSKGCDIGDEIIPYGAASNQICVRDQCKALIHVWVQDPAPPVPGPSC